MSVELPRTGPEIPGFVTVDWQVFIVGWLIPPGSECGCGSRERQHLVDHGVERLLAEAVRLRRMITFPQVKEVPEGILIHAVVCGHPS